MCVSADSDVMPLPATLKVPQTAKPPDVAPTEKKGDGWQTVQAACEIRYR